MSLVWNAIQHALSQVFSKATDITFVWEESLQRIPRAPIGVLSLESSSSIGRDSHRYTFRNSDTTLDIYGHRELTIGVEIRARLAKTAPSSHTLAEKARLALANPVYRDQLRAAGLVFVETHPLVNLDMSRSAKKELRSTFDVVFRLVLHEQQSTQSMGFFDSVSLREHIQ